MGFNYWHTYRAARDNVIELSIGSSVRNAEHIEMFFLRHEDVLLTISESLEHTLAMEGSDLQDVETLLHDTSVAYNQEIYSKYADKEFTGVYAAVDGLMIHGLKTPEDLPEGYTPLTRQWYKEAIKGGGKVVFSKLYQDIYTSATVMTAAKMLRDGESVVAMDIALDDLQFAGGNMDVSIMLNGQEYAYGYGFILTDQGVVVAHRDETERG